MIRTALVLVSLVTLPQLAHAHGTAARGVGAGTINAVAASISPDQASFGLRFELRQFGGFSDAQLLDFARRGEDVHQHEQEMSALLSGTFGLTNWMALDVNLPLVNMFRNFREGALSNGTAVLEVDDASAGVGDLSLTARLRPLHIGNHHVTGVLGIKLPTGMTHVRNNLGDRLGAHNQPGSGSTDYQFGVAYSYTGDALTFSCDAIYNLRTLGATNYRSGNLLQLDAGAAYRVTPWFTPIVEVNAALSERDVEDGGVLANSGVRTVYLSPALSFTPADGHQLFVALSVPVLQAHPGIQNDELFRTSFGYGVTLDWSDPDDHDHPH